MKKLLVFAVAILGFSAVSFGQANATASATGTIIAPITIVNAGDMNFGNIAVSPTVSGTVILATDGTRTVGGSLGVTLPATAGSPAAAHFTVGGAANYTYTISAIAPITVALAGSPGTTMAVNAFLTDPALGAGNLGAGASETINVGATLNVAAGQAPGIYTSATPFSVTVNYN